MIVIFNVKIINNNNDLYLCLENIFPKLYHFVVSHHITIASESPFCSKAIVATGKRNIGVGRMQCAREMQSHDYG